MFEPRCNDLRFMLELSVFLRSLRCDTVALIPGVSVTHAAPSAPGLVASSPHMTPRSPRSPAGRPSLRAIEMDVRGANLTFFPPDSYDDNAVNTDPPQLRLKLEWV